MISLRILALIFILNSINEQSVGQVQDNLSTLQLLQVVYRHGDRSPLATFPNNPYNQNMSLYWPSGLGQLTERGKDQQYDLGAFLRQRYGGFLNDVYTRKEIHVLSSDTDRTLMSAESNLLGLFPVPFKSEGGGPLKSGSSKYVHVQLVPIHTIMKEKDRMLHMSADCPKESQESNNFHSTSPVIQKLQEENQEFIEFIVEKTGIPHTNHIFKAAKVHDTLFVQQCHNMTLPDWANSTVMDKLREIRSIGFAMASGTPELKRLKGGPLVGRLVKNMVKHDYNSALSEHKMFMHSAHDDTIAAVMSSLNIFEPHIPPYAAALMVEFHKEKESGKNFVEFFYRNSTQKPLHNLKIPGCGSPCYLSELVEILKPVIPMNWERECNTLKLPSPSSSSNTSTVLIYRPGIVTMFCFLVIIASSVLIWMTIHTIATKRQIVNANNEPIIKESYVEIV